RRPDAVESRRLTPSDIHVPKVLAGKGRGKAVEDATRFSPTGDPHVSRIRPDDVAYLTRQLSRFVKFDVPSTSTEKSFLIYFGAFSCFSSCISSPIREYSRALRVH
ncbi:MAG: hypothetical protein ABI876_12805, partial [Bacteroidota bacterium]